MSDGSQGIGILLTATVDPGDAPHVARRDPSIRYADYRAAMAAWLEAHPRRPIVFCENSGFDITPLVAESPAVEFLSYQEDPATRLRGKGYGEMGILAHALECSETLRRAARILKVTGRFYIRNSGLLLARLEKSPETQIVCDLRQNLTAADSRVFCASRHFLDHYLLPRRGEVDVARGILIEHALARAAHAAMADGLPWTLMPLAPILSGISGTFDQRIPETPDHIALLQTVFRAKAILFSS